MALSIRDRRVQISIAVAIVVVILVVGISVTVLTNSGRENKDQPAVNSTTTVPPKSEVPAQMAKMNEGLQVDFKKARLTEALPPGTTTGIGQTELPSTLQATIGTAAEDSTKANTEANQTEAAATVPPATPA